MTSTLARLILLLVPTIAAAQAPPGLHRTPVAGGFSAPLAVRHAGDARLFVLEQGGRIRIVEGGSVRATPFLHIGSGGTPPPHGFTSGGERGLLGVAFAPDYASSGRFYINYTDGNGDTVVARYSRDAGDANRADPNSGVVILRIDQDFANHNGGDLHFGPDGMLYIGLGDGGSGNDPCNRAQTLAFAELDNSSSCAADSPFLNSGGEARSRALLGKLLRIDVSRSGDSGERCGLSAGSAGYAVPNDNPYAGGDGICDEVYASGLRNPWRFSFDRANGELWIGDVGQNAREEIDRLPAGQAGLNFGWRCREGAIATPSASCLNPGRSFVDPVLDYGRDLGGSITGGYRYRGPQASMQGRYFFADFVSGRHFVYNPDDPGSGFTVWRQGGNPSSFGEGADGELYYTDFSNGCLYRLDADRTFQSGFEALACAL